MIYYITKGLIKRFNELICWQEKLRELHDKIKSPHLCPKKLNDIVSEDLLVNFKKEIQIYFDSLVRKIKELENCVKIQEQRAQEFEDYYSLDFNKKMEEIKLENDNFVNKIEKGIESEIFSLKSQKEAKIKSLIKNVKDMEETQNRLKDDILKITLSEQTENKDYNIELSRVENFIRVEKSKEINNNINRLKDNYEDILVKLSNELLLLRNEKTIIEKRKNNEKHKKKEKFFLMKNEIEKNLKTSHNLILKETIQNCDDMNTKKKEELENLNKKEKELKELLSKLENENEDKKVLKIKEYVNKELKLLSENNLEIENKIKILEKNYLEKNTKFEKVLQKIDKDFEEVENKHREEIEYKKRSQCDLNKLIEKDRDLEILLIKEYGIYHDIKNILESEDLNEEREFEKENHYEINNNLIEKKDNFIINNCYQILE